MILVSVLRSVRLEAALADTDVNFVRLETELARSHIPATLFANCTFYFRQFSYCRNVSLCTRTLRLEDLVTVSYSSAQVGRWLRQTQAGLVIFK
jgi:hypothetical protein